MLNLKLNLRTIAVVTAAVGGFILAPSQGCIAGSSQQGATDGTGQIISSPSHSTDESDGPSEGKAVRFKLVPHVTDGGKNIYIKTPFLYEEGPVEAPEALWV